MQLLIFAIFFNLKLLLIHELHLLKLNFLSFEQHVFELKDFFKNKI